MPYVQKTYKWYNQKGPLGQKKMEYNANNLYDYFCKTYGYTKNALAGMLGNMQYESTINPACWQGWKTNPASRTLIRPGNIIRIPPTEDAYWKKFTYAGDGFGLVQWTQQKKFLGWFFAEATHTTTYAGGNWYHYQSLIDYNYQFNRQTGLYEYITSSDTPNTLNSWAYSYELYRLIWEIDNDQQWDSNLYHQTFAEFMHSTEPAYNLGVKFLHAYERPAEYHDEVRGAAARKWYEFLGGTNPGVFYVWQAASKPYWMGGKSTHW